MVFKISEGHIEVLRLLIAAGADLDLKDKVSDGGITALIEASKFNRIETVRELIRAGANINSHDIGGETALYIASRDGHVEIVSELLAAGALVNSKYSGGWTALHNAARGGHNGVVYELLRFGAEPKMKNNDNETAAEVGRNDEVKTTIGKAEAIRAKKLTEDEEKVDQIPFIAYIAAFLETVGIQNIAAEEGARGEGEGEDRSGGEGRGVSIVYYLVQVGVGVAVGAGQPAE